MSDKRRRAERLSSWADNVAMALTLLAVLLVGVALIHDVNELGWLGAGVYFMSLVVQIAGDTTLTREIAVELKDSILETSSPEARERRVGLLERLDSNAKRYPHLHTSTIFSEVLKLVMLPVGFALGWLARSL